MLLSQVSCDSETKLIYGDISSSSQRVRMALEMKKIPHQLVNVKKYMDKNGFTKEYEKINPTKLIPALFIDGHWITETMAIIEYIEETRPYEPRILPKDFFQRAVSRRIAESVNSGIQPL